eukprot:SAG31_NODE_7990_length_1546_cov_1.155494_3_plen_70_part_01
MLSDDSKVSVDTPRLRWLQMEQNPLDPRYLNTLLKEALLIFTIVVTMYWLSCDCRSRCDDQSAVDTMEAG